MCWSFKFDSELVVQSKQFCKILATQNTNWQWTKTYNAYNMVVKCQINVLTKTRITLCNWWSSTGEALRFLDSFEIDKKKDILMQQTNAMSRSNSMHEQKYTPDILVQGFEYFEKSRSPYKLLRNDYELPSISALTRLTYRGQFIYEKCFSKPKWWAIKLYFLLVDEVYVKAMVSYHGRQLFCNSVSNNTQLVKTVLDCMIVFLYGMIVCLYGGPKVFVEVIPIGKLDTDFLYDRSKMLIDQIKDSGGNLVATICDNKKQAN